MQRRVWSSLAERDRRREEDDAVGNRAAQDDGAGRSQPNRGGGVRTRGNSRAAVDFGRLVGVLDADLRKTLRRGEHDYQSDAQAATCHGSEYIVGVPRTFRG